MYVHVDKYLNMYICTCRYIFKYVYMYVHVDTCVSIYIYLCVHYTHRSHHQPVIFGEIPILPIQDLDAQGLAIVAWSFATVGRKDARD